MSALGGDNRKIAGLPMDIDYLIPPVWTSDGKKLAYVSRKQDGKLCIEIADLINKTNQQLPFTDPNLRHISISPDGQFIAYSLLYHPDSPNSQIKLIRVNDSNTIPLTDDQSRNDFPHWSNDGKYINYISNRQGTRDIWRQKVNDNGQPHGDPEQITDGRECNYAVFSREGNQIVFSKGRRATNLYRIPILKGNISTWENVIQLTFEQTFIGDPDISHDNNFIIFVSDRSGTRDYWKMPVNGGNMELVSSAVITPFLWTSCSADGRMIAFHSGKAGYRNIWVLMLDNDRSKQLTTGKYIDNDPIFSPDSKKLAFRSNRDGHYNIWTIRIKDSTLKNITNNSRGNRSPQWSPDGNWITYHSGREGGKIWRIPSNGGRAEPISGELGLTASAHIWEPDGKYIYFTSMRNLQLNIWELDVETRKERQVTDLSSKFGSIRSHNLTTDGEYLYFIWEEDLCDLWVIDLEVEK